LIVAELPFLQLCTVKAGTEQFIDCILKGLGTDENTNGFASGANVFFNRHRDFPRIQTHDAVCIEGSAVRASSTARISMRRASTNIYARWALSFARPTSCDHRLT